MGAVMQNNTADSAAELLDGIRLRDRFQAYQLSAHLLFMIFSVGGDCFREDGHGGGGGFYLFPHFKKLDVGFVAILAELAAEGRLDGADLLDR